MRQRRFKALLCFAQTSEIFFYARRKFSGDQRGKGQVCKAVFKTADTSGESRRLASLNAGFASNAVPGFAQAEVFGVSEEELKTAALKAEQTGASFEISAGKVVCSGTAAHASLPETGNNPITALFEMLSFLELDDVSDGLVSSLKELFPHGRYNGEALGVDMSDKLGRTTLTLDIADFDGVNFSGCFDARTPMCANEENFAFVIKKKLEDKGFEIENTVMVKPHYVDESLPFVQTLIKSYESYSGDKGECISIGGGTYVHDIDGGVAFGAIGRDVNTNMHGADEFMLIDDLMMSAAIFTQVIAEVCK